MNDSEKSGWCWVGGQLVADAPEIREQPEKVAPEKSELPFGDLPHRIVLTGKPIPLGDIEFRIVQVLARRPYHAFTTRQIADAINTADKELVSANRIPVHVRSLRQQLGFFHDYVQSVPFIGYRFKP